MADVNVVYNFDLKTITVDVLVDAEGQIIAALPVLPRGAGWTVTWHLKGEGGNDPINHPYFENGIELGSVPDGLEVLLSASNLPGDTHWTIGFNNDCAHQHEVTYAIFGNRGNVARDAFTPGDFVHDPTISVVSDPPNG
jgi:hypothetical protein